MDKKRIDELNEEIYWFVFHLLDNEPELNGYQAGEIAAEIQEVFLNETDSFVEKD